MMKADFSKLNILCWPIS